jgi:hypothetical protein
MTAVATEVVPGYRQGSIERPGEAADAPTWR